MSDAELRAALEAADPAELLPQRAQARRSDLPEHAAVVDVWEIGRDGTGECSFIALLQAGDRLLVVPGRAGRDGVRRDAGVAGELTDGTHGAFTVELFDGGVPAGAAVAIDVDQSNDSVVLDDTMVKWQLDAVPSPAPERLRALAGTDLTPDLRALVTWRSADGLELTIATAAQHLPGARDGWTWAVELVRQHAQGHDVDAVSPFTTLGIMTARMHDRWAALGVGSWSSAEVRALRADAQRHLDEACTRIDGEEGERLRARRSRITSVIDSLAEVETTPVMDIHGDLHIGQVLQDADGRAYAFVDFDGNPVLSPELRMAPQPAARDVAGMLASIDHVGRVVNHRTPGVDVEAVRSWIPLAQDAFLAAYRTELAALQNSDLLDDRLLPALLVDQESREFLYSAAHLPHWRYVPDAALTDMFPEEN